MINTLPTKYYLSIYERSIIATKSFLINTSNTHVTLYFSTIPNA